jgi:hypothetical protein
VAFSRAVFRLTLAFALLLQGCGEDPDFEDDTGFFVGEVVPVDGDKDVLLSTSPNLLLSSAADTDTCTIETVQLLTIGASNAVGEHVESVLEFDGDEKILINPINELVPGYSYMISIRSGSGGCTSENGVMIRPFASRFTVSD